MLRHRMGQGLNRHIEEHSSLYLFVTVLFMMGIIFGTFTVQSLGYAQQSELYDYFQHYITEVNKGAIVEHQYALAQNFIHYVKYTGAIWLLGLSIIGLPVILLMVFLKGVFVGFSVGFLVHQLGWKGLGLSFLSIVPQNLIAIPLLITLSVISISFSTQLIRYLFGTRRGYGKPNIARYFGIMLIVAVVSFTIALFETYLSPILMRLAS
jgi:stage II sporulation protein M